MPPNDDQPPRGPRPSPAETNAPGADRGRREFLRNAALLGAAAALSPNRAPGADPAKPSPDLPAESYQSLGPAEADFTEAMMDIMCPADALSPSGTDCGLARFIDRQLAGAFGSGDRLYRRGPWRTGRAEHGYQLPLTPEEFYKAGIAAANVAAQARFGRLFPELSPAEAETFLNLIADGKCADVPLSLAEWFNELVHPLFVEACFSDPIYGGNRDKVFWKMVGYPGLPAFNGLAMAKFRGVRYPGSATPKSIQDFG